MMVFSWNVVVACAVCGMLVWMIRWLMKPFHAKNSKITGLDAVKLRAVCGLNMILQNFIISIGHALQVDPCLLMNKVNLPTGKQKSITITNVKVYVYEQSSDDETNCIIYMHGGGFAYPYLFFYHWMLRKFSKWSNCRIFSIDYRLSPKFSYPSGHEDCYNVTKYILTHTEELRIKPGNIVVCGDSAGGNLVATTSLRLCQRDSSLEYWPKGQIIINPLLQYVASDLPSYTEEAYYIPLVSKYLMTCFASAFICGTSKKRRQFLHKLQTQNLFTITPTTLESKKITPATNDEKHVMDVLNSPFAFPLMTQKYPSRFPPAHILACEYDILYSEAVLFHSRLCNDGIQSTFYNYSTIHVAFAFSFLNLYGSKKMFRDIVDISSKIFGQS